MVIPISSRISIRRIKKLAKNFVDAIKRLVERIKSFVTDRHADTKYGEALLKVADDLYNQVQQLWNEAVESGLEAAKKGNTASGRIKNSDRGYKSYKNINLDTLDDEEIKVYNSRGWAYDLFSDEDKALFEEKFELINPKIKTNKGYILSDNSRIIEINNKIVLLGGKYDNPVIYHVFVINATSENDARPVKEFLYDVITERKVGNRIHYCEVVESISSAVIKVQGRGAVRSFEKSDYEYNRGSSAWQRATLPSYFNHFGYTTKYQDRTGNNTEATQEVSKRIDTDYLSAVERGDMETAQRMVDKIF